MQRVTCPHCGAAIPAENINMQHMKAVCPACDALFSLDELKGAERSIADRQRKRRKIKPPKGVSLNHTANGVEISYPASQMSRTEATEFAVYVLLITSGSLNISLFILGLPAQFALLIAAAVFVLLLLEKNVNQVTIGINGKQIYHREGPAPLLNNRRHVTSYAAAFPVYPAVRKHGDDKAVHTTDLNLYVQRTNGTRYALRKSMKRQKALFIAQELQAELNQIRHDDDFFETEDAPPPVMVSRRKRE